MSSVSEPRSEYTVLARRFRPQIFSEVVGQEMVAQALRNAIEKGCVAHAYLFTGARGVGKTSMARILAKSLNCPHANGSDPCNECEVCQGISTGSDVDVLEIDGASNRGIDDIRALRSNVNIRSMRSRYKVYIIDEVHMLTKEAFNALLKTLEEPPPNVKFIFCTTEANKLPDTILSRCQRFDFGTIQTSAITTRLEQIAAIEGKVVDPAAIDLVARRAAGSMRDSQSLFDQLLAFGGERISAADVHRLLGTAPDDRLIEIMDAVIARRRDQVLELFHTALATGVQLAELTDQLLAYVRDLLILACDSKGVPLLSVMEQNSAILQKQAANWGLRTIVAAMQVFTDAKVRMQRITYGRAVAELALIRLTLLEELDDLSALMQQLQSGIGPGAGAAPGKPQRGPVSPPPPIRPVTSGSSFPRPGAQNSDSPPAPRVADEGPSQFSAEQRIGTSAETSRAPLSLPPISAENSPTDSPLGSEIATPRFELQAGSEMEFWTQVISQIKGMLKDNARFAESAAISGPNHLVLLFPKSYDLQRKFCEQPTQMARLEKLASDLAGRQIRVSMRAIEGTKPVVQQAAIANRRNEETARKAEIQNDPLVRKALEIFGGAVITE